MEVRMKPTSILLFIFLLSVFFFFFLSIFNHTSKNPHIKKRNDTVTFKFQTLNSSVLAKLKKSKDGLLNVKIKANALEIEELVDDIKYPDGKNFNFLSPLMHNPSLCHTSSPSKSPFVPSNGWVEGTSSHSDSINWLTYVHSAVKNRELRQTVRMTWGRKDLFKDFSNRVLFVVGEPANKYQQHKLLSEFQAFGDLLQGNFVESYKNITYKAVFSIKWVAKYCGGVDVVTKANDDSSLNIFKLRRSILHNNIFFKTPSIVCNSFKNNPILREGRSCRRWCVSKRDLPNMSTFPTYCSGIAYAMSISLLTKLAIAADETKFFWIDDVFITGLLTQKVQNLKYFEVKTSLIFEVALSEIKSTKTSSFVAVKMPDVKFLSVFWNAFLDTLPSNEIKELNYPREQLYLKTFQM